MSPQLPRFLEIGLICRLPPLLRAKGIPIDHVSIVPPPRNLNPRFVSWKGASVICNMESLGDMWIRRDEWEAVGARALKERCLFL
jgi:actin-related protein 8